MACPTCELHGGLERVRYFSRKMIGAEDMTAEQRYFRERLRRHNRFAHGWGVVCGCDVKPAAQPEHPWRVRVCPGFVLGPHGDEIAIGDGVYFDLTDGRSEGTDPCATSPPSRRRPDGRPGRGRPCTGRYRPSGNRPPSLPTDICPSCCRCCRTDPTGAGAACAPLTGGTGTGEQPQARRVRAWGAGEAHGGRTPGRRSASTGRRL